MGWLPQPVEAALNKLPLYPRNWVAFFVLGLINNFAYVVINSSADDLVSLFKTQNLVHIYTLSPVADRSRLASSCGVTSFSVSLPDVRVQTRALADY